MAASSSMLDSQSTYARHRQEALALINQLRTIGRMRRAQADLDLPRIAVIGNQSAGKSSLVEAISGINVPRDADAWQCKVSIRWEFDHFGARRDEVREEQFGEIITKPEEVELALRRAQAAILNPLNPVDTFVTMQREVLRRPRNNQLKFSRNSVCVDLSGPQLTDLSFVDLPAIVSSNTGIVQNAEDDVVALVEELVKAHIKGNCLILVALPMSDDIENQKAMRLAREADPQGLRTIGTLLALTLIELLLKLTNRTEPNYRCTYET
ncbi:hypothetical protein NM688_g1423 [Phlebia brevispora]|uniref:Uncharacterized protein n=1 Tax=Phlebia brevispora TaxID=194682 RepID=A0ACC1TBL9_9APHY|nr:hypothetical protein NM688_g1423 [Phlebia brevispora]